MTSPLLETGETAQALITRWITESENTLSPTDTRITRASANLILTEIGKRLEQGGIAPRHLEKLRKKCASLVQNTTVSFSFQNFYLSRRLKAVSKLINNQLQATEILDRNIQITKDVTKEIALSVIRRITYQLHSHTSPSLRDLNNFSAVLAQLTAHVSHPSGALQRQFHQVQQEILTQQFHTRVVAALQDGSLEREKNKMGYYETPPVPVTITLAADPLHPDNGPFYIIDIDENRSIHSCRVLSKNGTITQLEGNALSRIINIVRLPSADPLKLTICNQFMELVENGNLDFMNQLSHVNDPQRPYVIVGTPDGRRWGIQNCGLREYHAVLLHPNNTPVEGTPPVALQLSAAFKNNRNNRVSVGMVDYVLEILRQRARPPSSQ